MIGDIIILVGIALGINAIALIIIGRWMNEMERRVQTLEETLNE